MLELVLFFYYMGSWDLTQSDSQFWGQAPLSTGAILVVSGNIFLSNIFH